ncbi:MAG: hypothetical protein HYT27_03565 [Parcubacteria group bacterium]|nr:hypothetical protein [Parcubacteria group bacterium]
MRGKKHENIYKQKALSLRREGKSYDDIMKIIPIPKSTLASWYIAENIPSPFTRKIQLAHLRNIRPLAANARRQERLDRLKKIQNNATLEVRAYPVENIGFKKSILAVLYWAEGAKHERVSGLKFVNTDPNLMRLYLQLLRTCYTIDERRLRIRLHVHYYHKIREVKKFWSELLNISISQFAAAYVKKRSRKKRFRKNFQGICFVYYGDSAIREDRRFNSCQGRYA